VSTDSGGEPLEQTATKSKSKKSKKSKEKKKHGAKEQIGTLHFHGGTKRSTFGKILLAVTRWLGYTEGMHALRVLTVTIALAIPAGLTSSAGFYYREKGIWAPITAQTGLVAYTADFVYSFALKMRGAVCGGRPRHSLLL
jgi:hypothetical protein